MYDRETQDSSLTCDERMGCAKLLFGIHCCGRYIRLEQKRLDKVNYILYSNCYYKMNYIQTPDWSVWTRLVWRQTNSVETLAPFKIMDKIQWN